jgi:flavin-binding protein dodecin
MMLARERRLPDLEGATMSTTTLHILPEDGAWAVKDQGASRPSSIHPTQAQAVASALEMLQDLAEAEVIVHVPDGRIRRYRATFDSPSSVITALDIAIDDSDDPAARAEALRITPSNARLRAGIGKYPIPPGDFDDEEMPC